MKEFAAVTTAKAAREAVKALFGSAPAEAERLFKAAEKDGRGIRVSFAIPQAPRSTGKHSQNSHIWGHIQQIAEETGNDINEVEAAAKLRAIKRGYPFKYSTLAGSVIPSSQANISGEEAAKLIEELHAIAAELGIYLREE